ncbi:PLP-dependent aminotransferase family protein [Sphingomonas cannabina]|uniref:MocR-like pyridoxine biosynthesis transcription factor PdxR n=1 Tax=Sphingomonas cannabina TaxID=2899123 RepID=UPI001F3CDC2D|nr:PLP-dependent aminotransferase family protein [Sphingomonas cannabina]UIJ46743.1 PLP-dependent aminotransferase family protein [Sphingomonas cannabina]
MLRRLPLTLGDRIDPAKNTPVYMQIIAAIVRDIERGRLTPGTYLPSSRELAEDLGVNRKTVVLAYEELIAQGWLTSAGTRGTLVSSTFPDPVSKVSRPVAVAGIDGQPLYRVLPAPARPLALPDGRGIKLDEGTPDGRLFPADVLANAYRSAVRDAARSNQLQYRDPLGAPALRESLAEMLRSQRGLAVTPAQICITRGSQNGIFLTAQALLRPGDHVIVEALTYEPAVAAFRALGARVTAVPLDAQGIDVEAVEAACRRQRIRALFLTPHHQFPTTVALRPERRLRLLELARQFGFAIIEDDYDHEFHFASQPLLPMAVYAPEHVVYVGSLSKLLLPALRIGYVVAPEAVTRTLAHAVSLTDGMGNTITENATAALVSSGELRRHARKARQVYATRRLAFAQKLRDGLGQRARFDLPDGGLAFWLRFPGRDMDAIEARAQAMGLRFAASRSYMASEDAPRGLRVGFASLNGAEADAAVAGLRVALDAGQA